MARVPTVVSRDEIAPEDRAIVDEIARSRGQIGIVWGAILQSPQVAGRLAHLGTYIRFDSALPDLDRELAMITTAKELDCEVEYLGHKRAAESFGASPEVINAIATNADPDALAPGEALVIRFARELLRAHRVSDELFQSALAKYGMRGVTDLIGTVGYMACVACLINGLQIEH